LGNEPCGKSVSSLAKLQRAKSRLHNCNEKQKSKKRVRQGIKPQVAKSCSHNCNTKQKAKKCVRQGIKPQVAKPCSSNCNKKQKAKKCVRFNSDAKTWDGQRQENVLLERVVKEFWEPRPNVAILEKLASKGNQQILVTLNNLLVKTVKRVQLSTHSGGALLIPSGGKCHIRLKRINIPHAKLLHAYIKQLYNTITMRKVRDMKS